MSATKLKFQEGKLIEIPNEEDNIKYGCENRIGELKKVIEEENEIEPDYSKITPSGPMVIIELFDPGNKAIHKDGRVSSLYIPVSKRDDARFIMSVGKVVKMNPSCYQGSKFELTGPYCKVGDWAYFRRSNGEPLNFQGKSLIQIFDDYVLGTVDDPKEIRREGFCA